MKGALVFLLFFVVTVVFSEEKVDSELSLWKQAVERIVSGIVLGPFQDTFSPEHVAKRTKESALNAQLNRFRAKVAVQMMESVGTQLFVCPMEHMDTHVVPRVLEQELRAHNFTTAAWIRHPHSPWCPGRDGHLFVEIPEPQKETTTK